MLAFVMPGGWQWVILLAIAFLIFGHRIPSMCRAIGSGIFEFRRGLTKGDEETKEGK